MTVTIKLSTMIARSRDGERDSFLQGERAASDV